MKTVSGKTSIMACVKTGNDGASGHSTFFGPPMNASDPSTAFNDNLYISGNVSDQIKINDIILYFKSGKFTSYKVDEIDSSVGSRIKASIIDTIERNTATE